MALPVNVFLRNVLLHRIPVFTPSRMIHVTQVKTLYSPPALGIDGFLENRKRINERFADYNDKFKSKMTSFVEDNDNMVFTEDLKNMVHMAEPADVELVMKMIKKFNSNTEIRFGSYVFGPVVMRMFHFLDAPKEALQCFKDPANVGFFDQQVSYQILLDLLYNNEMYEEMYEVFEIIKERQLNMTKYPKYPVVLILAACYKQNSPESLQYAINLWTEMVKAGAIVLRRASTFFAALALKQGAPHIALEAIASQKHHYVTIRNIKAIALAELNRVEDSLMVLRQVLDVDSPNTNVRNTFFDETLSKVRAAVEKTNKSDITKEFETIEKALRERNLIDNQLLDTLLNAEINLREKPKEPFGDNKTKFSYRRRNLQ